MGHYASEIDGSPGPNHKVNTMEEVIALEGEIRGGIAMLKKKRDRSKPADLLMADAEAILAGKPTRCTGTRLDRLRYISKQMRIIV